MTKTASPQINRPMRSGIRTWSQLVTSWLNLEQISDWESGFAIFPTNYRCLEDIGVFLRLIPDREKTLFRVFSRPRA